MAVPAGMELEDDEYEEEEALNVPSDLVNLLHAAELGDPGVLQQALASLNGSINDAGADGDSALHLACLYGHLGCVQILLGAGASLNVRDEDGAVPLHDACAGGYINIVKLLLTAAQSDEGKLKELLEATDIDGDTPLHHAARGHHEDVVQMLLSYGASPRPLNLQGKTAAELTDEGWAARAVLEQAMGQQD